MTNTLDTHVEAYSGKNLYDFDNEILLNWYPQRIATHSAGARSLLELGLGHGFSTDNFSRLFERHLVLEGSGAVIENFQRRFPACRAEVVETYFENFDTDERFDVIVMGFILEHVDDPRLIIERYKHFLAPRGRMFIAVPNAAVMNRRLGHLAGLLPDMEALSENDLLLGHKRYYTVESLSADVQLVGCQVDRMEGIYLKPLTTRQMVSLNLSPDLIQSLCQLGVDYPELSCGILAEISAGKGGRMKVLIVGGTSSLATALRPALARFAQVQTAGRQGCDHAFDLAASADGMVLPAGFDVVVNTASHFGGSTAAAMDQAVAINVQGTLRLAEACARAGVSHFVQVSSIFAQLPSSSPFFSAYAATKRQTDELLQLWSRSQTMKLTVLRPSQFYGAGEATRRHQPFLCTLVDKAAQGEDIKLFGSHDAQRNFIHIDDVAATIAACIEQGLAGTYACQYPKDHGFAEIARAAVQAFGTASRVDFDPSRPDVLDNVLPIDPALFDKLGIQPRVTLAEGMQMEARRRGVRA